jgi:hypothetical protein
MFKKYKPMKRVNLWYIYIYIYIYSKGNWFHMISCQLSTSRNPSIITPCVGKSFYFNYHFPFFVNITKLCCILCSFIIQKQFFKKISINESHYYNSWFFQLGFLVKKYPKMIAEKNYLTNLDKSFWPCLARLGSQIGPCHFD